MRRRARKIDPAVTTRCQNDGLCAETMQRSIHKRPRDNTAALAIHHDEIEHKILDKKFGSDPQSLSIERVEQSMPCSIRSSARAWHRILAEIARVATERPLLAAPLLSSCRRHPRVSQDEDCR